MQRRLLGAEGFDWVEGCGSFGRVNAKEEADCSGDQDYNDYQNRIDYEGKVNDGTDEVGYGKSQDETYKSTCESED